MEKKKSDDIRIWEQNNKKSSNTGQKGGNSNNPYVEKKAIKKAIRQQESLVKGLEKKIQKTEEIIAEYNEKLKSPSAYSDPANKDIIADWQNQSDQLNAFMLDWEKEQEKLEKLKG